MSAEEAGAPPQETVLIGTVPPKAAAKELPADDPPPSYEEATESNPPPAGAGEENPTSNPPAKPQAGDKPSESSTPANVLLQAPVETTSTQSGNLFVPKPASVQEQRKLFAAIGYKVEEVGETWYPISKKWLETWKEYTCFKLKVTFVFSLTSV